MITITIQDDKQQHDALPKSTSITRAIRVKCDDRTWKAPIDISLNYYLEQSWHEELRWYIEDHLIDEPFATRRASAVHSQLVAVGKVLAAFIEKWSKSWSSSVLAEDLLILVIDDPDSRSIVARLPWETLEDSSLWDVNIRPKNISVDRLVPRTEILMNPSSPKKTHTGVATQRGLTAGLVDAVTSSSARGIWPLEGSGRTPDSAPDKSVSTLGQHHRNILVLTARPTGNNDIPFRTVSSEINKAVSRLQNTSARSCNLHICRPGTLAVLESELKAHDPGYYDVVHLDTHGWVNGESAYLDFVDNSAGFLSAKPASVAELVPLILERKVSAVVLNSCRSAAAGGGIANVARSFVAAGVPMAIGMTFKISDAAVALFTAALYGSYLNESTTMAHAAAVARNSLRVQPHRLSYLNYKVRLADDIVPRVYVGNADFEPPNHPTWFRPGPTSEPADTNSGREADLFELETSLATGCRIVHLQGPPGIGKTWLITQAMSWWVETDFGQCHYVQCSTPISFNALESLIKSVLTKNNGTLADGRHSPERKIFAFDSLESLSFAGVAVQSKEEEKLRLTLRRFIKRLIREHANVDVILVSRMDLPWFNRPEGRLQILAGLKQRHALQLALQVADELKAHVPVAIREARIHMQLCIELVDGNPLAIEIMIRAFSMLRITIEVFYQRLLSGKPIPIDWVWVKASEGARFLCMLNQNDAERSKLDKFYSLTYLAYFWGRIPADHLPYKFFLARALRTYQVVYAGAVHVLGAKRFLRDLPLWLSWKTYELILGNETLLERTLIDRKVSKTERGVEYPIADPELPGAILREPDSGLEWPIGLDQMGITLRYMSRTGMISETSTNAISSGDGTSDERYYHIGPVVTLFMRDQLQIYPPQLRRAGEVAFVRYHDYRMNGMPAYETQLTAVVEAVTKQLHSEFESFMTAANMILDFDFTFPLCNFADPVGMSLPHWSDLSQHRLFYYSGYLRRFLKHIDPLLRSDYCGDRRALGFILLRHDSGFSTAIETFSTIYAPNHRIVLQVAARGILRRALELNNLIGLPSDDPHLHSVRQQLENTTPAELNDLISEVEKHVTPEQLEQAKLVLHQPGNIYVQGIPQKDPNSSTPDLNIQQHVNQVLRSLPKKHFRAFTLTEVQTTRTTLLELLALCTDPTSYPSERWQIHALLTLLAIEFDEIAEAKAYLSQIRADFEVNQADAEGSPLAPRWKKMERLIEARIAAHEVPLRMNFATENRQQLWNNLVDACRVAEVELWTEARSYEILLQAALNGNFLPEARENLRLLRAYWENDDTDADEQKKQLTWLDDVKDVLAITQDFISTLQTALDQDSSTDSIISDLSALDARLEHFLTTRGDTIDIGYYMKINVQLQELHLVMLDPTKIQRWIDKRNEAMQASYLGEGLDIPTDHSTVDMCAVLATLPEGSEDRNRVTGLLLRRTILIQTARHAVTEEMELTEEIERIQNRAATAKE